MYEGAYLKNLKIYLYYFFISLFDFDDLVIYLFIYRYFAEKRPLHMQEFSLVLLLFYEKKTLWILHYSFQYEFKTLSSQPQ